MSIQDITGVIADVLQPAHFFTAHGMVLVWEHRPAEEVPWEIFHGRLLPAVQTRARKTFAAWNVYPKEGAGRTAEPILSVKLDSDERKLHVTRAILSHVWEAYDAGDNVIRSRETIQWVRELVGSIALDQFPRADKLRQELASLIFQAVVGTSRLPLTSVEAPMPAFSLGQLAFFDRQAPSDPTMKSYRDLVKGGLAADLPWEELAKLLETVLRTIKPEEITDAASLFARHWKGPRKLAHLLRTLFNYVSLSPLTTFVDTALAFVSSLVDQGTLTIVDQVDFLSYLLRQLGRHLTAYDLITFHHRGANYPDALLLDTVLKAYLTLIEHRPEVFAGPDKPGRLRRRGLRQGCLLRRFYEGHLVPDAPTSPGENARVLPPPHVRVPDEQLLEPANRKKRLYDGEPLTGLLGNRARQILQQSMQDLNQPEELRELGTAIFIDRSIDPRFLFSHEAFSRAIAVRRLTELEKLAVDLRLDFRTEPWQEALAQVAPRGVPIQEIYCPRGPVVSLADARRASEDFVVLRTLPACMDQLCMARHFQCEKRLLVRILSNDHPDGLVALYDDKMNACFRLSSLLEAVAALREALDCLQSVQPAAFLLRRTGPPHNLLLVLPGQ